MKAVEWTEKLELGIPVIDKQHRRIVDTINTLIDEPQAQTPSAVAEAISGLVDYTYSHFAFEESLMEEAGYEYLQIHQQSHEAFTRRIDELHAAFREGQDVSLEIAELLQTWLINHIMEDDSSYAPLVRQMLPQLESKESGHWIQRTLKRFFS